MFLRGYELGPDGEPHATGKLITNRDLGADGTFGTADDVEIGGMSTWGVVKAQARDILGINLTDADFDNVPLLATDAYGNFIKGPNGFPQVVIRTGNGADGIAGTADDTTTLVEGNPAAPIDLTNAVRTGHQFLIDIAHSAIPVDDFGNPLVADADDVIGAARKLPARTTMSSWTRTTSPAMAGSTRTSASPPFTPFSIPSTTVSSITPRRSPWRREISRS